MIHQKTQAFTAVDFDLILDDRTSSGKKIDWRQKKLDNTHLSLAYDDFDQHTADRLRRCSNRLVFGINADGTKRLRAADFCRVRLCPICQWRRSLKLYGQMAAVMDYLNKTKYQYIFLTLTVKNCELDELSHEMDMLSEGFRRMFQYREVKTAVVGWYRGFEVTQNLQYGTSSFGTFHPHLHMVVAVRKSYFTSRDYISQERWGELWQKAIKTDYVPRVDVRKIKGSTAKAVCEATKYVVKPNDYIVLDDWDLTVDVVKGLDTALHGRRLIGFGGVLRDARAALRQDDVDSGDLINVDADIIEGKDVYFQAFGWHTGFCQYVRTID